MSNNLEDTPTKEEQKLEYEIDKDALEQFINRKPSFVGHRWVQRGIWVVCTSCAIPHGFNIGVHQTFNGLDEVGNPILIKRDL